jgi:histidine triad (HIT) family protein
LRVGGRKSDAATSCWSIAPDADTAPTTRRGSWTHRPANSWPFAGRRSRRKESSLPEECLFCRLYADGEHVAATDGFVAIRDINPKADVHLLIIPQRHVASFHDVGEFTADETRRMLEFIAATAREQGLDDYRVVVNVGEAAGQTIFHLHWHLLGGRMRGVPA